MASSAHHPAPQHSRYPLTIPPNSRDEALRLPSIKDLNFQYSRRQDGTQHNSSPALVDSSITSQENSARHVQSWSRSNPQPQSPALMQAHQHHHQHQHQHQHQQQQHTPPLSAGHEPSPPKTEYPSKSDNGGFVIPGMPLSAQSTPVPGSVTIGSATRGDDAPQSKRSRRISENMGAPRDPRSPHTAYPPHYAPYPPAQLPPPPPNAYHQMQASVNHPSHPVQPALEHAHQVPVSTHPGYAGYHYLPNRIHSQHAVHPQPPHGNPYPSPGPPPAPPPQGPWEQPHHSQPHQTPPHHSQPHQAPSHHPPQPQHQHQPQHQPYPQPLPPPPPPPPPPQQQQQQQQHSQQHLQHPQHPHVLPHHQPPQPPQPLVPQHHMHPQQQQHQTHQPIPPPPIHHSQHPQVQPHQQAPPPIQQHPQIPYNNRTTPIVPTNIDTRTPYPLSEHERMPPARDGTMSEIIRHCSALYTFASRYAQLQQSMPDICPSVEELSDMSRRAVEVVRLLEEYRRLNIPETERVKMDSSTVITPPDDHRPPKRPWEDMVKGDHPAGTASTFPEQQYPTPVDKVQSTAEQDMEIIRTKRATSTAGGTGTPGQPKSKYRKRSRATPPGKCHSCNIRETPEWRRGPDGARTLCNACGLHYAKLQRKRDKTHGQNGDAPRIDMETLRASTRAAELDKSHSRSKQASRSQQSMEPTSPMEPGKPLPQQHHQGSFQLVSMMSQDPSASTHPESNRVTSQQAQQGMTSDGSMTAPTPPWSTNVPSSTPGVRSYAPDQLQHQSFIRTSHPTANDTSPR